MTPLLAPSLRPDRGFERIYRRHAADVYRYAFAMLRNPADAEDVTQTTFLNAYRAYERGERPRAPQNWLITIAHNVCRQRFRQSERRVQEVALNEDVAEALVDDDNGPTIRDIQRALGHLPFNQRSALIMRELEGRSYTEIADALELSVSAVETLLFRARRTLREQLEGALTCRDAELALSRQIDGRLSHGERAPLRAHLRECKECARLARKQRAQSAAIKALGAIPLPPSLSSFGSLFGGGAAGGAAAVGGGLALKAAAVITATAVVVGVGYEGAKRAPWLSNEEPVTQAAAAAEASAAGGARGAELSLPAAFGAHLVDASTVRPTQRAAGKQPARASDARGAPWLAGGVRGRHMEETDEAEEGLAKSDTDAKSKKRVKPAAPPRGRGHGGRPESPGPPASVASELPAIAASAATPPARGRPSSPPGQTRAASRGRRSEPFARPRGGSAPLARGAKKEKDKAKEAPKDKLKEKPKKDEVTGLPPTQPQLGKHEDDDGEPGERGKKPEDKDAKGPHGPDPTKKDEAKPPVTIPPAVATAPTPLPSDPSAEDKDKDKDKDEDKAKEKKK
jgi:RNA polymerase sigma factor (sigma-70 family)